jgi:hypothetical protein
MPPFLDFFFDGQVLRQAAGPLLGTLIASFGLYKAHIRPAALILNTCTPDLPHLGTLTHPCKSLPLLSHLHSPANRLPELYYRFQHSGCAQFMNCTFTCPVNPETTSLCHVWRTIPAEIDQSLCNHAKYLARLPGNFSALFGVDGTLESWHGDFSFTNRLTIDAPPQRASGSNNTTRATTEDKSGSQPHAQGKLKLGFLLLCLTLLAKEALRRASIFLVWHTHIETRISQQGSKILRRYGRRVHCDPFAERLGKVLEWLFCPLRFRMVADIVCVALTLHLYDYGHANISAVQLVGLALGVRCVVSIALSLTIVTVLKVYERRLVYIPMHSDRVEKLA